MNPFYKLNQTLNSIGAEKEEIVESKQAPKSPAQKTLEEALRYDLNKLMEDGTGGMNFSGSGSLEEKKEKWIQKATKPSTKGDLHKALHVPQGEKIPKGKIEKATHSKNAHLRHMAQFAKNVANEEQLNEYLLQGDEPVDSLLQLNLFDNLIGDSVLTDYEPEFAQSPEWNAVVKQWKPKALKLAATLEQLASQGKTLSDEQADTLGDLWYDGSDAYETPELAASFLPRVFSEQYNAIMSMIANLDESDNQKPVDPSKGIPGNYPVKGKMERLRGKRDYYEADHSEEDIMDYLNRKLAPFDKQQAKEDAIATPYNKGSGKPDAYNGMEFEGNAFTGKLKSTPKGGKFKLGDKEYTDTSDVDEGMIGQAAGTIAGTALGGPVGGAIGGAIGNQLTGGSGDSQIDENIDRLFNRYIDQAQEMIDSGSSLEETLSFIQSSLEVNGHKPHLIRHLLKLIADNVDTGPISEGFDDMYRWLAQREKEKGTGKFDKRKVSTGTVYTRKFDDEPEDDDTDAPSAKGGKPRGRGRPAGTKRAIGAKHSGTSKLARKDAIAEQGCEVCSECGQPIAEKAVSKAQQKFMGMVHAAQKGEKPASKEVAKVAKGMSKKAGHDFAATKHKGLPEKVKAKKTEDAKPDYIDLDKDGDKKEPMKQAAKQAKEKKVDETTTSGSVATATKSSKGGMSFGQGIYDSWNREIESMISESVEVKTKISEHLADGDEESITITATGSDVHRLKELLAAMGIEQSTSDTPYCPSCGCSDCQCETVADEGVLGTLGGAAIGNALGGPVGAAIGGVAGQELTKGGSSIIEADVEVDDNSPDYPTNQEESDDALQYSGGLDGKKSTGQSTIPVLASQEERQVSESNSFFDLYKVFSKIKK